MGTNTTRGRRTPPEITDDAIRDLFERALAEAPEARPKPPEITTEGIRRLFEDAGWGATTESEPAPAPEPQPAPEAPRFDTTPSLRTVQCPTCYGSGTELCASCYGSGSQTISYTTTDWEGNVEYVTDWVPCGCSGGTVACGWCGGLGTVTR